MKQSPAITVIKISSLIGIAAVVLTVLSTILSQNAVWWFTVTPPLYQIALLIAAFWGWDPQERNRYALLIVAIIRLVVTTGTGFSALLAIFSKASLLHVGSLLQTVAAVLFLIGTVMHGKEKQA